MSRWAKFEYREFYDVPRSIVVTLGIGERLLLESRFDETMDEYDGDYAVYLLPDGVELSGSWDDLSRKAVRTLGRVPVPAIRFDQTKRREIDLDSGTLPELLMGLRS